MIRVFLADDHPVMRDGLKLILSNATDIEVVGDAGDGQQALQDIARLLPDVALMDIAMPMINGIEALRALTQREKPTRVIMLSMHQSEQYVQEALRAGAWGYLLKGGPSQEVLEAIRSVHKGHRYFAHEIAERMRELMLRGEEHHSPLDALSARERQVLQLVVEGKSSSEIGKLLFLSPKTVDTYRSRLMQKLNVGDVPALVRLSIREGIVSADQP